MIASLFLSAMVSLTAVAAAGGEPAGKPAKVPSVPSPPRSDRPAATPRDKVLTLTLAEGVTMQLALIPAGEFAMGSPSSEEGREPDEGHVHQVTITAPFHMGIHEVTQRQYEAVMGKNPSHFQEAARPVETISWEEAVQLCRKVSQATGQTVRLPTEAEWECACRAQHDPFLLWGRREGGGQVRPV